MGAVTPETSGQLRPNAAATDSGVSLADLLDLLVLSPSPEGGWLGAAQQHPEDRVFGGLLLAQALAAAGRTVDPALRPVSLQADFVEGVATDHGLQWQVDLVSDATSLSTRRSRLVGEAGRELFSAVTRWATVRNDLPSYSAAMPVPAPSPALLPGLVERFGGDDRIPPWWRMERPVHVRHAVAPPYLAPGDSTDRQTIFFRATAPLPDDAVIRAALLAYVTDMSIVEPAFLALGSARHLPGSRILSLTHSLTYHADADLTDWHQVDCRVAAVAHGRAIGVAEVFDSNGAHVATASQLGLVKAPLPR
jgi:acyl-CoA thioesterase-2